MYEALGFTPPVFGHMSLILAPDKSKLSKRHGATSVGDFRAQVRRVQGSGGEGSGFRLRRVQGPGGEVSGFW